MKKLLLLSLLLIVSGQAMAQAPWSPVHRDKLYTYKALSLNIDPISPSWSILFSDPIIQNIKVEKDSIVGTDTLYHLNRRAKPIGFKQVTPNNSQTTTTYLWDFQHPSILNQEIRITPAGEYYFQGLDTFLLKPQAGLGEFWTYKDTIIATVIDLQPDTLWNTPDSVKTILLSNNDTIKLSRNFGILQFPDPDSLGLYCTLLGLQKDTVTWGLRTPDFWDAYNLNVGDVLMYRGGAGAYEGTGIESYLKLTITQKNILPDGYTYSYTKTSAAICYPWQLSWPNIGPGYPCSEVPYTPFTSTPATHSNIILIKDSCSSVNYFYPDELSCSHRFDTLVYGSIFGSGVFNFMNFAFIDTAVGKIYKKLMISDLYPASDSVFYFQYPEIYRFETGLGFVEYNFSGFESSRSSRLIGYVKNGDTTGIVYSDSILVILSTEKIESQNNAPNFATLAPNPSPAGHAQLLFDAALNAPIDLTIYNTMGQLVASRQTIGNETSLTLDYPELPKGLYLIRLKSGGKEQVLKWLIQ